MWYRLALDSQFLWQKISGNVVVEWNVVMTPRPLLPTNVEENWCCCSINVKCRLASRIPRVIRIVCVWGLSVVVVCVFGLYIWLFLSEIVVCSVPRRKSSTVVQSRLKGDAECDLCGTEKCWGFGCSMLYGAVLEVCLFVFGGLFVVCMFVSDPVAVAAEN